MMPRRIYGIGFLVGFCITPWTTWVEVDNPKRRHRSRYLIVYLLWWQWQTEIIRQMEEHI